MGRRVLFGIVASGVIFAVGFALYWATVLLIDHHPAFIPNAERRAAMFRFLARRQPGRQQPRQGDHWIF